MFGPLRRGVRTAKCGSTTNGTSSELLVARVAVLAHVLVNRHASVLDGILGTGSTRSDGTTSRTASVGNVGTSLAVRLANGLGGRLNALDGLVDTLGGGVTDSTTNGLIGKTIAVAGLGNSAGAVLDFDAWRHSSVGVKN